MMPAGEVFQCSFSEYALGDRVDGLKSDDKGELKVEEVPEGNAALEGVVPLDKRLLGYGESLYELVSDDGGNWYEASDEWLMGV